VQAITGAILSGATAIVETTPTSQDDDALAQVKDFLGMYAGVPFTHVPGEIDTARGATTDTLITEVDNVTISVSGATTPSDNIVAHATSDD
ncbi:MAG: hypothetical protein ACPG7F_06180, partial [Aggregatilineales bacterium]